MIIDVYYFRVESHHSTLKKQLLSSMGNFETCWSKIHALLETSHNAIKASFQTSLNVVHHQYKSPVFKLLRGVISIAALKKIHDEMKGAPEGYIDPLLCGCVLRKTCGLPCAHEIAEFVREDKPIPVDRVDGFWRKLNMEPSKGVAASVGDDIGAQWTEMYSNLNTVFEQATESERLLMLKRMREVVNPITTSLIESDIPIRTRSRPESTKAKHSKSTKRDPSAFELVESINDSCSPNDGIFFDAGVTSMTPMWTTHGRQKQQVIHLVFYVCVIC